MSNDPLRCQYSRACVMYWSRRLKWAEELAVHAHRRDSRVDEAEEYMSYVATRYRQARRHYEKEYRDVVDRAVQRAEANRG